MDFLALYLTARLLHITVRPLKLCLSASIGSAYSLAAAVLTGYFTSPSVKVILLASGAGCAYCMSYICFSKIPKETVRSGITFIAVSIGIGGTMTALYSTLSALVPGSSTGPPNISPTSSPVTFAILALISCAVSLVYGKFRNSAANKTKISATATFLEKKYELTLLCDSGNLLREPIGGKRVIVIGSEALFNELPPSLRLAALNPLNASNLPPSIARRIRLIPTKTVIGNGIMLGVVPESITVSGREIDAVIAIDPKSHSYGECDGVIPAALLTV